ncbi:Efflux pump radE [Cladobotryum mycophilum]|uniref:Efflux pump radE n=1 Tax=Cladobotryum mycophilum TaxID=491253 RepID=A0ABR0SV59_9HYPO
MAAADSFQKDVLPPQIDDPVHRMDGKDEEAVSMSKAESANLEQDDPNAVNWDGPNDPENPLNWAPKKKWANIIALSVMTILVPLGSSMFAPGVPKIMAQFHSTDPNLATFVVSVYILGFAFGPLLAAPMSEIFGRAICYNVANLLFIVFTVAAALSKNMAMLIVFRFLMGFAGSTPITNGSGTISDMFPIQERGKAMSVWAIGPMLGPCIGPVAGGFVVQDIGWRWVFWIIAIAAGVVSVACFFFVTETHHPTLLRARVRRLKNETGNQELYCALDDQNLTSKLRVQMAIIRPIKMLFTLPPILIMSLYIAVAYGILYLLFSTFSFVYPQQYGFSSSIVGLAYIPTGLGMLVGISIFGTMTDRIIRDKLAKGETPVPEDRLPPLMVILSGLAIPAALFWYGWTTKANVHWIAPMIAVAVFSFGLIGVMMCVQVYLVDSYIQYAASVVAAITVLRSLVGALLPLAGLSLYESIGLGWGNSLLGFIALALIPVPLLFRKFGPGIRARFPGNL